MSTVSQTNFIESLNRRGGYIDIRTMSPELKQELHAAGITDEQLREIAGRDLAIRGSREFDNLFRRIDALDGITDFRFTTHDSSGDLTRAGRVYHALQSEVDGNRARAAREGGLRFAADRTLERVMDGGSVLREGSNGEHVRSVQQALIDMGFEIPTQGASGTFDRETTQAVMRFQREMGLNVDGVVSAETLGAITSSAPPPGHRIERSADYDRLFRDGRLDIAIAIGYEDGRSHQRDQRQILSGLRRDGWTRLDYDVLSPDDRRRYGLTADRYDPNAEYFTKQLDVPRTNEPVDAVIRMVTPGSDGGRSRRSFEQAIQQDEVVYYSGNAQLSGNSTDEGRDAPAGLRASIQGRGSDLNRMRNRPDYQVMMLYGRSTERYLPGLRSSTAFSRDHQDTDILTTTIPTGANAGAQHALRFVQGITNRESNSTMLGGMSDRFGESGFLSNSANRVVRYAAP